MFSSARVLQSLGVCVTYQSKCAMQNITTLCEHKRALCVGVTFQSKRVVQDKTVLCEHKQVQLGQTSSYLALVQYVAGVTRNVNHAAQRLR